MYLCLCVLWLFRLSSWWCYKSNILFVRFFFTQCSREQSIDLTAANACSGSAHGTELFVQYGELTRRIQLSFVPSVAIDQVQNIRVHTISGITLNLLTRLNIAQVFDWYDQPEWLNSFEKQFCRAYQMKYAERLAACSDAWERTRKHESRAVLCYFRWVCFLSAYYSRILSIIQTQQRCYNSGQKAGSGQNAFDQTRNTQAKREVVESVFFSLLTKSRTVGYKIKQTHRSLAHRGEHTHTQTKNVHSAAISRCLAQVLRPISADIKRSRITRRCRRCGRVQRNCEADELKTIRVLFAVLRQTFRSFRSN